MKTRLCLLGSAALVNRVGEFKVMWTESLLRRRGADQARPPI